MERIGVSKLRNELTETLSRVAREGQRFIIRRRGKDVAGLIPPEDAILLEEIKDRRDVKDAQRILADPQEKPVPYRSVRSGMGIETRRSRGRQRENR